VVVIVKAREEKNYEIEGKQMSQFFLTFLCLLTTLSCL
jgi:hypothetical protein